MAVAGRNKFKINLNAVVRGAGPDNIAQEFFTDVTSRLQDKMCQRFTVADNYKVAAGTPCIDF